MMASHSYLRALSHVAAALVGFSLLSPAALGQTPPVAPPITPLPAAAAALPVTPLPGAAAPQSRVPMYQGVPVLTAQNVIPLDPNDPCPPFVYCEDPNVCPPCPEQCPPYAMQQQPMWVMPQQQPMYQQPLQPTPQAYVVPQQPPCPPVVAQPVPTYAPSPVAAAPFLTQGVPPVFAHRHAIYGELLYMRPRNADVAYALPIDGPVAPVLGNEVPNGPVAVVDPEFDPGFRAGFALALDQASSVAAQYTSLSFEGSDSATAVPPSVLRALVTHGLGADAATDALDASATENIDLDIIDAEYRGLIHCCEGASITAVNIIAGAEYAQLDQSFDATYTVVGGGGTTTVNTDINFDGIGPRLGLQAEQHSRRTSLFVYGVGIANLLVGEFDASYVQANSLAGTQATTSWSAGRIVPAIELELGVGWITMAQHLRLSLGYRVNAWFNVVTTDDWINSVQSSEFDDMSDTFTLDGAVARAEYRW